jgi:hypothetical protein
MTIDRAIEVGLTSTVAATTTALAMLQVEESGLMILVLSLGVSSIVGYFSAQMTVRVELASLKTEIHALRGELHRYYQMRHDGHPRDID